MVAGYQVTRGQSQVVGGFSRISHLILLLGDGRWVAEARILADKR